MNRIHAIASTLIVTLASVALAQVQAPASIPLWEKGAPGSEAKKDVPEGARGNANPNLSVTSVHNPSITPYLPSKEKATGAAVIVFPGGGHSQLSVGHEGYTVGQWLADQGIAGFVVKYRLAREQGSTYKIDVEALADTQRAIRMVRSRAKEWNVDPNRVGMIGFSAGAELIALSMMKMEGSVEGATDPIDQQSAKPNFQAHIYPGQSGKIIPTKDSPPAFLAAGGNDRADIAGAVDNGQREWTPQGIANVYMLFKKVNVPVELHIYAKVGHGFGMRPATDKPPVADWPKDFLTWMDNMGFLKPAAAPTTRATN